MPMRGELPQPVLRPSVDRSGAEEALSPIVAAIKSPDLELVVYLCTLGYLLAIWLILAFPNFSVMVLALDQFP